MSGDLSNRGPGELDGLRAFLSGRGLAEGFVKNNVGIDRYDTRLFSEVLDAEPELRELVERAGRDAPKTFGPLLLDLFASFYKMVPELVEVSSVDPAHLRANRPFVEKLREDEGALIARLSTATDEVASALATIEAGNRILLEFMRRPALGDWMGRQAEPRQGDPAPPDPGSDQAAPSQEDEDPREPPPDPSGPGSPSSVTPDVPGGFAADLRALVRAASRAASGEAGAHARALRDWGLRPADLRTVPIEERLEIARKMRTKRMQDLADLLGRMRNHRRAAERRKVKANRDQIHGIETSGDIARALPSEIASAFGTKNPLRKMDFYRRLSERSVPSYSLRTDEPVGRGPVIAMIDSSWSMSGPPMEWASAVALALAHAAAGSVGTAARRVHAIFFNARIVLEAELAPGERDVRKFLALGTVAADGGTRYDRPVSRALELLSAGPKPGEGVPDLLLVTDGRCELAEEDVSHLEAKKTAGGFKLVTVLVGDHARAGSVEPFSDKVVEAQDLARASGARDAAGAVFESL